MAKSAHYACKSPEANPIACAWCLPLNLNLAPPPPKALNLNTQSPCFLHSQETSICVGTPVCEYHTKSHKSANCARAAPAAGGCLQPQPPATAAGTRCGWARSAWEESCRCAELVVAAAAAAWCP